MLKKEVRRLRKQREQEQSLHRHEMDDLRQLLEGKVSAMLKAKDARNKQLADSLAEYEKELSSFAGKCVEMEANVVSMTIENSSLKRNVEVTAFAFICFEPTFSNQIGMKIKQKQLLSCHFC